MTELVIDGITVKFPFDPYPPQKEYMKKVIECLDTTENAILESPTGTGKTLSLLCATMAWIESQTEALSQRVVRRSQMYDESSSDSDECGPIRTIPTVIYATRTHPQILQAMRELKKTEYKNFKAAVIASRDQLCLNPDLKQKSNADKIYMCKDLVENPKEPLCSFYKNIRSGLKEPELQENIIDIEELDSIGRKHHCCPYYITKKKAKQADVIFLPYAYLIDPKIREANDIRLKNSIIILDEGHNVSQVCEQSASTSIQFTDVRAALKDINYVIHNHIDSGHDVEDLKRSLQNFKASINSIVTGTHPGGLIFLLLEKANITKSNYESTIDLLEQLIIKLIKRSDSETLGRGLKAMVPFLQTIFSFCSEKRDRIDRCFKVYVEYKPKPNAESTNRMPKPAGNDSETSTDDEQMKILNFWCFSPAFRMKSLLKENIRCIILTSSTLAPFSPLLAEMEITAPIQLINRHVIKKHQVCAKILSSGVDQQTMNSSFKNRENENYLTSVGKSVVEIAKVVPDGLLVFFPSYDLMGKFQELWKERGIWRKIEKQKPIFLEPKKKDEFYDQIKRYYAKVRENKGAIFMAVIRAKISEGIDFTDIYGRAVVIIGIPYAPSEDPRVQLKKEYLDERQDAEKNKLMSGSEWYALDAVRAANQAIGRVIRHKHDYGAVFLCDHRFNKEKRKNNLPAWIQSRLKNRKSVPFSTIMQEASQFFEKAERMLPTPDNLPMNPESFILFEDDDYPALALSEEPPVHPIEPDVTDDELNSPSTSAASLSSDSNDEQQIASKRTRGTSTQNNRNISPKPSTSQAIVRSTTSEDEAIGKPKRTRKIDNEIDSDSSQEDEQENPIWNFMKDDLGAVVCKKLKKIFFNYNNDSDYKQLYNELIKLFNEKSSLHHLRGMTVFIKPEHQSTFQADYKKFAQLHQ